MVLCTNFLIFTRSNSLGPIKKARANGPPYINLLGTHEYRAVPFITLLIKEQKARVNSF